MADIPLRTYVRQLDDLIERKNVDEAIAHSRHILSFYPKHLDTYRMLGKALLEKGRHGDAADVFQRVLSVLPDDFISHVGMAIVREDEANLDAALWHMERAYEAMPSNGAIQQELCRLYGRRDGVVPPKARLTRGALGRMYLQGGLYPQAEAELNAALADDAERIDLQTILAQVYWYADNPAAAAQLCGTILQSLPYSQVANRILRETFRARGHDADAALYRQRLEALDPYEALAAPAGDGATLSTADQVAADKVLVTRLDYVAGMEGTGGPDWIASIGARFEESISPHGEGTPDWLSTPAEPALDQADLPGTSGVPDWLAAAAPAPTAPNLAHTAETAGADVPDWLNELSQASAASEAAPETDDQLPDWLKGAANAPAEGEVPAWLQSAEETPAAATAMDETMPGWLAAAQEQAAAPDAPAASTAWMDEPTGPPASGAAPAAPSAAALPTPDNELPDWIKGTPPAPDLNDDLPDWLKASTGPLPDPDQGAATAPWLAGADAAGEAAGDAVPDWMSTAPAEGTPNDLPDWMATTPDTEMVEPAVPPQAEHEQPKTDESEPEARDLGLAAAAVAGIGAAAGLSQSAGEAADDVPDWMAAFTAESPASDTPPWLATAPEPPALPASEPTAAEVTMAGAAATPASELPDWLQGLGPAEAALGAEPPADSADLPDWLKAATGTAASDETPPWLSEAPTPPTSEAPSMAEAAAFTEPEPPANAAAPEELTPPWLSGAEAITEDVVPMAQPVEAAHAAEPALDLTAPEAEQPGEEAQADWLSSASPASPADEVPAWLRPEAFELDTEPVTFEADAPAVPETPEALLPSGLADGGDTVTTPAGDLPDWLRALTDDTEDRRTEHWEALADAEFGEVQPEDLEEAEIEESEQPLPEGVPDWMKAMAVNAPPPDSDSAVEPAQAELAQPEASEPEAPEPSTTPTTIELPDFLQLASPEAIARANEPYALEDEAEVEAVGGEETAEEANLAPAELPDWLKALAPETPITGTAPGFDSDVMAAAAAGLNLDEAPDWMKAAQPGTPPATGGLEPEVLPEWLQAEQPSALSEGAVDLNLDDAPDWLQAAASLTPADTVPGAPGSSAEAEAPAWLQDAGTAGAGADLPPWAQAEAPGPTDTVINFLRDKETPDWLAQLQHEAAGGTPEAGETAESALAPASQVPEAEPEAPEVEVPAAAMAEAPAALALAADEVAATPVEPSLDDMSPDETMRWLESLAARQGAPAEEMIMTAPAAPELPPAEPAAPASELPAAEAPTPETQGGLPDWLREVEASFEVDALADTAPHKSTAAPLPDWLTAPVPAEDELEASDEPEPVAPAPAAPDWISTIETLDIAPGDTGAEAEAPELGDRGADEAMRWLEEQTAQAEAHAVPVQGLTGTEGMDDAGLDAAEPDIEAMDADEAMRWLEKLAAQQGASAEELLSAPDERPNETPAWIAAAQAAAEGQPEAEGSASEAGAAPDWLAEFEAASGTEPPLEPGILPDWLTAPAEAAGEPEGPAVYEVESPAAETESAATGPDFDSMDADAAMRWLEGLAAQQGAAPEELTSAPEERPSEAPAWVQAKQSAAAEGPTPDASSAEPVETAPIVMETGTAEPAITEPPAALEPPEAAEPEAPAQPAEPARETGALQPDISKLARLSDRLAASRRAKEAEIEARFAQQRAEQEEARRLVWENMQAKKAAIESAIEALEAPAAGASETEAAAAAATPAASEPPASEPVRPEPAAARARGRTGPLTPPAPPDESAWVPAAAAQRRTPAAARYAGQPAETVLEQARAFLRQQQADAAAEAWDYLVSDGQMVETAITELEGAAEARASVPLLRVLGDAYVRGNHLQAALDTYRQALRRL